MRAASRAPVVLLLIWSALLAGCQDGTPGQCQMYRATELPLRYEHGNIYATTLLNDTPTNMVFDTGAQETVLTEYATKRLSLDLEPAGYQYGVGGFRSGYRFVARTFQIGTLRGRRFDLMASDMEWPDGHEQADGLLGANFLAAYDVDLDLPDRKAILYAKVKGCSTAAAYLPGPLYPVAMVSSANPNEHRAMIRVTIDGKTLVALVDSGAAHTVVFRNAARRLGLRLANLTTDEHFHVHGIGPDAPEAVRHVMTPIEVGDLTINNMPVAIVDQRSLGDADMLLGLDFLRRVHVWYGFSSHTLIMQYPPQPSPPVPR